MNSLDEGMRYFVMHEDNSEGEIVGTLQNVRGSARSSARILVTFNRVYKQCVYDEQEWHTEFRKLQLENKAWLWDKFWIKISSPERSPSKSTFKSHMDKLVKIFINLCWKKSLNKKFSGGAHFPTLPTENQYFMSKAIPIDCNIVRFFYEMIVWSIGDYLHAYSKSYKAFTRFFAATIGVNRDQLRVQKAGKTIRDHVLMSVEFNQINPSKTGSDKWEQVRALLFGGDKELFAAFIEKCNTKVAHLQKQHKTVQSIRTGTL
jgi:hypothetical protein